jgi:hypothetical protein
LIVAASPVDAATNDEEDGCRTTISEPLCVIIDCVKHDRS